MRTHTERSDRTLSQSPCTATAVSAQASTAPASAPGHFGPRDPNLTDVSVIAAQGAGNGHC